MANSSGKSVFVSYAHQDNKLFCVKRLVDHLESVGLVVYSDLNCMEAKTNGVADWCASSIAKSDAVIVICGPGLAKSLKESLGSPTAFYEFGQILERARSSHMPGGIIFPVVFSDDTSCIPDQLKAYEHYRLSLFWPTSSDAFKRLIRNINLSSSMTIETEPVTFSNHLAGRPARDKILMTQIQSPISWKEIQEILRELDSALDTYKDRPDVVVSLNAEGALVASLFCLNHRVRPLFGIESRFVLSGETPETKLYEFLESRDIRDKRILLIDSETNSGISMKMAQSYLQSLGASQVFTFSLAKSASCPFRIDYAGFEFHQRPSFPWEWTEAFVNSRHKKSIRERYE